MKKFLTFFSLALALAFAVPAQAVIKQVTTVTNASASTIVAPAQQCGSVAIQNNGLGAVRISWDGGAANAVPIADPTNTTGYLLPAGAQIVITYAYNQRRPVIRAILVTATTTTLDIVTDDTFST